jgi:hypothetical protein
MEEHLSPFAQPIGREGDPRQWNKYRLHSLCVIKTRGTGVLNWTQQSILMCNVMFYCLKPVAERGFFKSVNQNPTRKGGLWKFGRLNIVLQLHATIFFSENIYHGVTELRTVFSLEVQFCTKKQKNDLTYSLIVSSFL